MKQLKALFSAMFVGMIGLLAAGTCSTAYAKPSTPEALVAAYIDGVAHQDLKAIIATTATDEFSRKVDFVQYVNRLGYLTWSTPVPSSDPLFVGLNRVYFLSRVAGQVKSLAYGLMTTREILDGKSVKMTADEAARFMSAVRADRLAGLTLVKVGIPSPARLSSENYQALLALNAKSYGADGATERLALLSFEGLHFVVGFSFLRYGENWTVESQTSRIAGTDVLGVPKRTTPEEFEQMLK